jgi:hypothetical protein
MILPGRLEFGNPEPDEVAPSWLERTSNRLAISAGISDHLSLRKERFCDKPLPKFKPQSEHLSYML